MSAASSSSEEKTSDLEPSSSSLKNKDPANNIGPYNPHQLDSKKSFTVKKLPCTSKEYTRFDRITRK